VIVRLRVLGESVIEVGGQRLGPEASALFGVLLYLALERGTHVPRCTLLELFWPGAGDRNARHCLRQTLYKLRQLGVELTATPSDVLLAPAEVSADFLDLSAGTPLQAARLCLTGGALGEVLPGYAPPFASPFDEWLDRQRDEVRAIVRRALSAALVDGRSRHRWAEVEAVARQCLRLDPLNEEATLALAEATALTGSKVQALTMLDRYLLELGPGASEIRLPATVLRKRIAERLPDPRYSTPSDAYFVGRESSVELLAGLLRDARAGRGRACLIWGEAGIGKTRLAAECAKAATLQGAQVLRVGCQASDVRRPLSVFVDAVPGLLNLRGALGCSPTSMRYLRRLTEHDPSATGPSEAAQEAEFLFASVRRAIFDLVDAIAGETTLVLVIEDVHWLDQTSWDVLREMIDWASSRRLLLLFTSRTEHATSEPEAAPSLRLLRHRLGALDGGAAVILLDAIGRGSGRAIDANVRDWCVRIAEGNPFFLHELASRWIENGSIGEAPQSLVRAVGDRLGRLSPAALRVLQVCGVLGRNATFERIEAASGYGKFQLLDAVAELEHSGLLCAQGSGAHTRHELVADAALGCVGEASLRLLHRNVANLLTTEIEASNSATLLWDCAGHWQRAGDTEQIPRLVGLCAGYLIELGLPTEAAALFERALHTPVDLAHKASLLKNWADTLRLAGQWRQAAAALPQVMDARLRLCPLGSSHCDEELQLLEAQWRCGASSRQLLLQALSCVDDERANASHRLRACTYAIKFADHIGDGESAERIHRTSLELASCPDTDRSDRLMCGLIFHASYGRLEESRHLAGQLIATKRDAGSTLSLTRALRHSWIPLMRLGEYGDALAAAREAFSIAERFQFASVALGAADDLSETYLEMGQMHEARRWCAVAESWVESVEDDYLRCTQRRTHSRLLLCTGNETQARNEFPTGLGAILADEELRRQSNSLALWLRLFALQSSAHDRSSAIETMKGVYLRARALGGQDFSVCCFAQALLMLGERQWAYSILNEYAHSYRREVAPPPYYLRDLVAKPQSELTQLDWHVSTG